MVIEHSLDVIGQADWLINLGPGPGKHGGAILYEGHVTDYTDRATPTGHALAASQTGPAPGPDVARATSGPRTPGTRPLPRTVSVHE